MTKLEFTNKIIDNLNSSMALNGKINLDKFIELSNKQYEAITVTHSCTTLKDKEIPTFEQYRNLIYKNKMHGFINKETSRYMDYEDMETRYNWLLKNL